MSEQIDNHVLGRNALHGRGEHALSRFLSLDLEVGRNDGRIHALAGVRPDTDKSFTLARQRGLPHALTRLDDLAQGTDFLLGHNLIDFDLPHLRAANPNLRLLQLPAVDTLRLNPLAFPRNPYHYLVKHYQDGSLRRGRLNDPELDALPGAGGVRRPAEGLPGDGPRPAHRLALAHRRERRRGVRSPLRPPAPGTAAVRWGGARGHRTSPRRIVVPDPGRGGAGRCRTAPVGAGLCAGVAVGGRRQLRHAALGSPPVPRRRPTGQADCATPPAPATTAGGAGNATTPAAS